MKLIDFETIKGLNITPEQCYKWTEEAIVAKEGSILPPKISMKPSAGVFFNVMPSIINTTPRYSGVKLVTRFPERVPSLDSQLLLCNADNGEFLALMDANWITTMRTGAVAAHSIKLLAKKNFSSIGMMGLGNTARAALMILASVIKDREFNVKLLKYKGQEIDFADRFKDYENLHFSYVGTTEELVKGSEVVISAATYLAGDVCGDEYFDEGVLVVPIHTLGFTNCDLFFDKVFADDTGHVKHFKYFDKFKRFAEVSDVLCGKCAGRENDKERILAYNIGISIHDINFAAHIYGLVDKSKLIDVDMHSPVEKFWI
ncbi:MAG: ornithine cyclodeaminase [Ruminococcaceae bacterium]|nr:ornithine cyclodeaminase [Oscillospiraceae bacterium]